MFALRSDHSVLMGAIVSTMIATRRTCFRMTTLLGLQRKPCNVNLTNGSLGVDKQLLCHRPLCFLAKDMIPKTGEAWEVQAFKRLKYFMLHIEGALLAQSEVGKNGSTLQMVTLLHTLPPLSQLHAAVQYAIVEMTAIQGHDVIAWVESMCLKMKWNFQVLMCFHGAGHGFQAKVLTSQYELRYSACPMLDWQAVAVPIKALTFASSWCGRMEIPLSSLCFEGTIETYLLANNAVTGYHPRRWHSLCFILDSPRACYMMSWMYFVVGHDTQFYRLFEQGRPEDCLHQPTARSQLGCIAGISAFKANVMSEWCSAFVRPMPPRQLNIQERERWLACVVGATWRLGLDHCKLLLGEDVAWQLNKTFKLEAYGWCKASAAAQRSTHRESLNVWHLNRLM